MRTDAIRLQPAFDDLAAVRSLIDGAGPYETLALTAQSREEREAVDTPVVDFVPPWFRRDFATHGQVHAPGAELLLHNPHYVEAAAQVFAGRDLVEPTTVYVNVMGPAPYPFVAHTDVPVFERASRRNCPVWLLGRMLASRLFEDERVKMVTAVAWIFDGPGGSFHYWPEGPDGPTRTESAPFDNVAVAADNETVYHGVGRLGPDAAPSPDGLSIDAKIDRDPSRGTWTIVDPDPVLEYQPSEIRITISWKAEVFTDAEERERVRSADPELPIDDIVGRFMGDLQARGLDPAEPDDPFHDEAWMAALSEAYPSRAPRVPAA